MNRLKGKSKTATSKNVPKCTKNLRNSSRKFQLISEDVASFPAVYLYLEYEMKMFFTLAIHSFLFFYYLSARTFVNELHFSMEIWTKKLYNKAELKFSEI